MPHSSVTSRQKVASNAKLLRLPLWTPTLLLITAGVLGFLLSLGSGNVGILYLITFAVGAVAGTLLVRPQGLVLAVSQIPVMFAIITPVVSWFLASAADPSQGGATDSTPTKTRLITAAYPIVQYFPWVLGILGVSIVVALWRYFELTRINSKQFNSERKEARQRLQQAKTTTESATRARRRKAESDRRVKNRRRASSRRHSVHAGTAQMRPASDIIRDAERRRLERTERFNRQREENARREAAARDAAAKEKLASAEAPAASRRPRATQQQWPRPERPARPARPAQPTQSDFPPARPAQPTQSDFPPARPAGRAARPVEQGPQPRVWGESEANSVRPRREAQPKPRPRPDDNATQREGRRSPQGLRDGSGQRYTPRTGESTEWPPRRERPRWTPNRDSQQR